LTKGGEAYRILTDRDIVVRYVAREKDVGSCTCGEICSSTEWATIGPEASIEQAVDLMRRRVVRRLLAV
jgi:hypothetical protein